MRGVLQSDGNLGAEEASRNENEEASRTQPVERFLPHVSMPCLQERSMCIGLDEVSKVGSDYKTVSKWNVV